MSRTSAFNHKSVPSFTTSVARCGVRGALRPFLRREDIAFVAALVVPEGTADYYRRAASSLLQDAVPVDRNYNELAVVFTLVEQPVDPRSVFDWMKKGRQIVVVTERRDNLPAEFVAGADLIAEVGRPSPEHFVAAAMEVRLPGMTREHAEFLSGLSLDAVLASVRPTRPLMSSMRQLRRMVAVPTEPAELAEPVPETRLEDMHGYGEAREWGLRLADDLAAWKRGEIKWEDIDRGAVLCGPPGCGKTTYAKALAASCGVELVVTSAARWQAAGHLGDYLKAMRASFRQAALKSPSILFLDELDSVGSREARTDSDNYDYRRQAINGLLECLDPSEGREGVVVVGATNDVSAIDPALMRPGRLELRIDIPLPDARSRMGILQHHLKGQALSGDLSLFVRGTRGWSGADIERLARDARRLARRQRVPVSLEHLEEAMPERYTLSADELRNAAVHEAGHALVGVLLDIDVLRQVRVEREAMVRSGVQSIGITAFEPAAGRVKTVEYYDGRIAMLMGGIAAEKLVFGSHADGAGGDPSSDLVIASDIATRIERHYGFGESLTVVLGTGHRPLDALRSTDPELRRMVDLRLRSQFERAFTLLADYRRELDMLAAALVDMDFVDGEFVRALCAARSENTASVAP